MSHYEERLDRDLKQIRERIAEMAGMVEEAVNNSVHALRTGNLKLASATILADHPVNRLMREIDQLCHGFIARHLPSAGHLRFLSSVIRANIQLERIGDYAVTIAREAIQLQVAPAGMLARELDRVAGETQLMLRQAMTAFNELNADTARSTMVLEEQMEHDLDAIYAELATNDDREKVKGVLAIFAVFTQLKRIADQAKNICEETVFAVTGDTKAPKVYNILFIDEDNSCQSQIAEAIARKNFPESGNYSSGGRSEAPELNQAMVEFMDRHGVSMEKAVPKPLDQTPLDLSILHVIVSLQGPVHSYFSQIPFHTTPLEWDIGSAPAGTGTESDERRLEEMYHDIALQVSDLMEILRGEGAS